MDKDKLIKDLKEINEGWKKLNTDNERLRDEWKKWYFELKEQKE